MIILPRYQILTQIYESVNSLVYRAIREQDNQSVILKVLKEDYPTPQKLTRYRQEYEISHTLDLDGIVRAYALEPYQRSLVIILEDFGASSLKQLMNQSVGSREFLPIPEFLRIAITIADILGKIHAAHVIHKDINPSNIVYNRETGQVKIIDFGISTQLSRETPRLKNPTVLEGTLAYMSPEQTGRMNRSLDYRTDFYSLGVTFYELLTGQLPFETTDALELVHCHIARQPVPPYQLVEAHPRAPIPEAISNIVMKLMAKTAEERYQSAFGIKADLELCLTRLQPDGAISDFPLASSDISNRFQIPQKLYGREQEIKTLLAAFERVSSPLPPPTLPKFGEKTEGESDYPSPTVRREGWGMRGELMLVAGYSGIGKSALVAEVHKPITQKRGYFISGKFDQFQRNIPYSAVVSAFKELVRQLLTESEAQLDLWREKLLTAVGTNAQVIIDVIPEVELIVGKQPEVPELGATETQNRFNLVFQNFIRAFCTKEHPLVIFLDDLQWADSATLKLIELMITNADTQYLFLIGAYRDNEVNSVHPLIMILDRLRNSGATINLITLAPLALEPISELIAETLNSDIASVKPLAELVIRKTEGNPFFVNEFLKTLHAENLLRFNPPQTLLTSLSKERVQQETLNSIPCQGEVRGRFWQWNISSIEAMGITDNVVELMIGKVKKLPKSTQQILRLAACVGSDFDLNTLAIISEQSPAEIYVELTPALQSGLILPTSESDEELLIQNHKFLHDRVQQAAYALIDEAHKQIIHLQIGRLLLQNAAPGTLSEDLFKIVDHLNIGIEAGTETFPLPIEHQERDKIAELNLMAGQKAKTATAYGAALKYFTVGLQLLNADSWQNSYNLTLSLYEEAAEAAYLNGDFQQMENLAIEVQNNAKNVIDKVKIYDVKIQAYGTRGKLKESIQIGLQLLKHLGVLLPEEPNQVDIQIALNETTLLWVDRKIEDLADLPLMTSPEQLAPIKILSSIIAAAYISNPKLFASIVLSTVNLSIKYGNAIWSAFGYACYGIILCAIAQDIESGYQFGKLSLNVREQINNKKVNAKTATALGHVIHWKAHCREVVPVVIEGYHSGVETGDFEFAGYCASIICYNLYFSGHELTELEQKIATYSHAIRQIRVESPLNWTVMFWQTVLNLLGQTENPSCLMGDAYNEERSLRRTLEANDRTGLYFFYLNKLTLSYLFGDNQQAVKNAVTAEQYLDGVTGGLCIPTCHFYDSLAHLGVLAEASISKKGDWLNRVNTNQEKMRHWANHAPMNFLHKFYLVEAEKARVLGQDWQAARLYEQAINGARENGFIQEEALAYELAAKFYLLRGMDKFAQTYMTEAHYTYTRWGAIAKVKDLEAKYPHLLSKSSSGTRTTNTSQTTTSTTTSRNSASALDLATVIKASQAISGEIVLDKLLAFLMKILIENAGAQSGFLILPSHSQSGTNHENWVIQASGSVDEEQVTILHSIGIDSVEVSTQMPLLSAAIVHYVIRTKENVVLNDAVHAGPFTQDTYILTKKPKSIFCIPLLDRTKLSAILYLENNLTTDAFTPERVELLKLLSAQVAISIENAQLYTNLQHFNENLEQLVQQRTTELSQALADLKATQNKLVESEKMAALGGLVAGVAHEINTPVGISITAASLLADKTTEFFETYKSGQMKRSQLEKFLDTAMQSSSMVLSNLNRAADLIQSFKQVAVDRSIEEQRTFNLQQYLSEVLVSLQPKLRTTQHQLEIRGDEAIALHTYPGALSQIITNLVMNSLIHAYSAEDAGHLLFDFQQKGEQIIFEYSDNGKGIPEGHLSKIFDPFFTTKRGQGGSGLGLHIVYNLVTQKLNGTIECESQVGVGTKFIIKMPSQVSH